MKIRLQEHSFCCDCVAKEENLTQFIVRYVKKKRFRISSEFVPVEEDLEAPKAKRKPPNPNSIKAIKAREKRLGIKIKVDPVKAEDVEGTENVPVNGAAPSRRTTRRVKLKVSYNEDNDDDVIGEPILEAAAAAAELEDPFMDDYGLEGLDGDFLAGEDMMGHVDDDVYPEASADLMDFEEGGLGGHPEDEEDNKITVKVEAGEEHVLQSIKDEYSSVQIKLEPVDNFDDEDAALSTRKRKATKSAKTTKAKKKKVSPDDGGPKPPKKWRDGRGDMVADEGTPMVTNENPKIFTCLLCKDNADMWQHHTNFKGGTGKYEGIRDHVLRFHPQLMKKKDPSVKQEEESHTAAVPSLPKTLECLECRLCSKKFTYLADIKAHVDESHKTEYRKSRCYKCKLGFINCHAARVHNAKFHGGIVVTKAIPGLTNRSDYPKGRRSKSWISLTCYVCSQEFGSKKEREDHVAEAHPDVTEAQYEAMKTKVELVRRLEQKRRCYAQKAYNDPGTIMENEANVKIFKCTVCSLNPTDKYQVFVRHLTHYHSKEGQVKSPALQCQACLAQFYDGPALQKHVLEEHPTVYRPQRCPYCPLGFLSRVTCDFHKKAEHPEEIAAVAGAGGKSGLTNEAAHFFRQQCGKDLQKTDDGSAWLCVYAECPFKAKEVFRVKRHVMRVHLKQGNWVCEICEKEGKPTQKFTNITALNHHVSGVHHGFSTKRNHGSTQEHCCDICGHIAMGKWKMDAHKMRVHSNYRPFVCSTCGKRFAAKHDLTRHEARSQGICHLPRYSKVPQRIKCPFCSYRTDDQDDLDAHLKARTEREDGKCPPFQTKKGQKGEFACEHCGQVYVYRESLQKHVRTTHMGHAGHPCDTCGKVYKHNVDLVKHQQKHHSQVDGLPFPCPFCPKRFMLQNNLKDHCEKKHNCNIDGTAIDHNYNPLRPSR